MWKEAQNKNILYKAKNKIKELAFLSNGLCMQTKAWIHKPNPTHEGFDLRTHAHGTRMQGCSKPYPKNKQSRKQSMN